MSDWHCHDFQAPGKHTRVLLPFSLKEILEAYGKLRAIMVRNVPNEFPRDEWAYLLTFLDPKSLEKNFIETFGHPVKEPRTPNEYARPRGQIALWLPNNVSLLGPLMLVMASLSGNAISVKKGSGVDDLASVFRDYVCRHGGHNCLTRYFSNSVEILSMTRDDPRQEKLSQTARVRMVFGSDLGTKAVAALDHQPDSLTFSFIDHSSEAWIVKGYANQQVLAQLIKVLVIYGKGGCTSPQRLIAVNYNVKEALELRDSIREIWSHAISDDVSPHLASENVMAYQWARAAGWDAELVDRNKGVVGVGSYELPPFSSFLSLPIIPTSFEAACEHIPHNIQTIGNVGIESMEGALETIVEKSSVKRVVPIGSMHHFSSSWDGMPYWKDFFERVEMGRGTA